jgi:hypothetical protein
VILLQHNRRPLLLRQPLHRLRDGGAHLTTRYQLLDRLDRTLLAGKFDEVDAFWRSDGRRATLSPDPIATQIQRDPVQPRRKLRLALETGERAECAKEGFLDNVTRLLLTADGPIRERVNRPFPAKD